MVELTSATQPGDDPEVSICEELCVNGVREPPSNVLAVPFAPVTNYRGPFAGVGCCPTAPGSLGRRRPARLAGQ
jgi:hypothetical protein